ncbi:MAG: pyridoxamine 5'-phosphate oxidase family protein [Anaerolineales bacterium]|nr:pyridoxamine 5'-phosphate oxidase family protein [Anaerolineales bacterium]
MRRSEKEITQREEICAVLRRGSICHLGLVDGDEPYVVPVSYGFDGDALYFHSAGEGRKIDTIRTHPQVCFEITAEWSLQPAETACSWGASYESVIGWGTAALITDPAAKRAALTIIMAQYDDSGAHLFSSSSIDKTTVVRIGIDRMTGKRS